MQRTNLIALTGLLVLGITDRVCAQQYISPHLIKPIKSAISSSYKLKNQLAEASKSHLAMEEVQGKKLPSVSATAAYAFFANKGNFSNTLSVTGSSGTVTLFEDLDRDLTNHGNLALAGLTAKQVIFSGLQISNAVKALQEKTDAEKYLAQATEESIALDAIATFDQLMLLSEVEKLIEDSRKRLNKENEYVNAAINNGLAIPYDRDKIKLAILELEAKTAELEGNRTLLEQKLQTLTHLNAADIDSVVYSLDPIMLAEIPGNIENRYEIKALRSSINAYQYLLKKEKGAALPQVFLFGNIAYFNLFDSRLKLKNTLLVENINFNINTFNLLPAAFIGVGAKIDIYSGGHIKHRVKQAQLDIDIGENKLQDATEQLNLLLSKNKVTYNTANKITGVKEQQIKVAKNNNEAAARQYREGLISITERLATENEFFAASLAYYMQVVEQRKSALELLHASGSLLSTILK